MKLRIWSSTERTSDSRPSKALLSSETMVLSWPTPPPLSSSESAPRTSSTSGLRPVRSSPMASPFESLPLPGSLGRLQLDELLAEQAGLADLGAGVVGEVDVPGHLDGDLGDVALELDLLDLADGDVVDLDRRLRARGRARRGTSP